MKHYIILFIVCLLVLAIVFLHPKGDVSVVGRIHIPAVDLSADVYCASAEGCNCGVELWHGGRASTLSDLSDLAIDDKAYMTLISGQRFVLECVEITPCIRVGRWLVSWKGIVRDNGDVLIFNNATVYRFTIL